MSESDWLRHTVATLAYRAAKTLREAPPEFAGFRASPTSRTPAQILCHLRDLLDWALVYADQGRHVWRDSAPTDWDGDVALFFEAVRRFDERLASGAPLRQPPERLFQGPIADALTHVGQIAMLRRMFGAPVRGENYFLAEIAVGRVGSEQAAPRREFA